MTYERFEQLPVWQAAIKLAQQIYHLAKDRAFRGQWSLRDQIERAAVSVSNNIAEGFERGTTQELLTFLYIARGSSGEVRSMLCLLETIPEFADLKSEISNLKLKPKEFQDNCEAGPISYKARVSEGSDTWMIRRASAKRLCETAMSSWKSCRKFAGKR
ncbi:MAG TPA: four helix bundle protein [Terriglobia bacterium]|nr:four helix bundle protein [Terriglobia bacterium]